MKWDYATDPPTAWIVEDGEFVPVDPSLVTSCDRCRQWFVIDPLRVKRFCSAGCTLKFAEESVASKP